MRTPGRPSPNAVRFGIVGLVALVPLLVAVAKYAWSTRYLNGDPSVFAINVADAAGGSFPLTGFYSRYGWSHPGPAAFYLFVPFHWLTGGSPSGLLIGTFVWQVAALGLSMWMAARRAATPATAPVLAAAAAAIQMLAWFTHPAATLLEPWTPIMATTLMVPFLLALWGLAEGDAVAGVIAAALGFLAAQIHLAFVVLGAVPLVVAAVASRRHADRLRVRRIGVAIGAGVVALMALPLVVDLVSGRTGNLPALVRFLGRDTPRVGLARALRLVAAEFAPRPTWLGGRRLNGGFIGGTEASVWWLALPVGLLLFSGRFARRRGDRSAVSLVLVSSAALATAVVAAAGIEGVVNEYLVRWRAPISVVVVFAICRALMAGVPAERVRWAGSVVAAVVVGAAVAGSVQVADRAVLQEAAEPIETFIDDVTRVGSKREGARILVRQADTGYRGVYSTLLWSLIHEGVTARVDPSLEFVYGSRSATAESVDEVWYVTDGGLAVSLLTDYVGAEVIAVRSPYSAEEEAEVVALQRKLDRGLVEAGRVDLRSALDSAFVVVALEGIDGLDPAAVARLGEFNERLGDQPRVGVIRFAPQDAPDFFLPPPPDM